MTITEIKEIKSGAIAMILGALVTAKRDSDGTMSLKIMAFSGVGFSVTFVVLQLIPIPGLFGVHFGRESYIMLIIWIAVGLIFYMKQLRLFTEDLMFFDFGRNRKE